MLEFSDADYQFFPADPSPTIMRVMRFANRYFVLPGPNHRIRKKSISGEMNSIRKINRHEGRILFVANHPSHSDPQFMTEVQRTIGTPSSFMAAYDVFLRSERQAWLMQKMGCFSIDREGSDRKAMSTAIDTLKQGDLSLTIFPEGNVYLMNDRVTPFMDGPSFIAVKAQQFLKNGAEVWVVPVSFKFTHCSDTRERVWDRLKQLADDSGYSGILDPSAPTDAVVAVGSHILSRFIQQKTNLGSDFNFPGSSSTDLQKDLYELVLHLVDDLENKLELKHNKETFIVDRVRKVRSKIHQLKAANTEEGHIDEKKLNLLSDRAILTFRILAYVLPYLNEDPTLDRYAETVERLCEDFYSRSERPLGPRKAMAKIGEPVSIRKMLEKSEGNTRTVIPLLTKLMEESIQDGIDQLNKSNDTPGTRSILHIDTEP